MRNSSLLCVGLAFLALSSAIEAIDITKMLAQYPELSSFNQHLTETKLADQINSRQAVTILAVDNSGLSSISGKPRNTIKSILSNHVIVDYYDEQKLMTAVESQNTQLTTLLQPIKVSMIGEGEIAFGAAANGAPVDVELVKTVVSQPDTISILQVTKPIIAPGIDGQSSPASSSTPKPQVSSSAPAAKDPVAASTAPSSEITAPSDAPAPAPSGGSPGIQMGQFWATLMGFGALLVAM